jgi:hypothetical protein
MSSSSYSWGFDSSGKTLFPGKVSFDFIEINEDFFAQALVFEKSDSYKGIATSSGTSDNNEVETLIIAGGDAYKDPDTGVRTARGGDINLLAGQGSPGGSVLIAAGRGLMPGNVDILGGAALVGVGGSVSGGTVRVTGGNGNASAVGGNVVIDGGAGNGGNGGSVVITGGAGASTADATDGGDVIIQGGTAQDTDGKGGKISLKTDSAPQGGVSHQWDFGIDGELTVPGSIIPDTNIAYDLGSATKRFKDIYLSTNTINLGGNSISVDSGGQLLINGNNAGTELVYFGGEGFGPRDASALLWGTIDEINWGMPYFTIRRPGVELQRALYELKIGDQIRITNPPFNYVNDTLTIEGLPTTTYDSSGYPIISMEVDSAPPNPNPNFVYALYLPIRSTPTALANGSRSLMLMPSGRVVFPTTTAPANNYGVVGDVAGMVAFDNNYVYYCTANYVDNSTPIWKRIALTTW